MPTQRAKGFHLVDQTIGLIRQVLPPQVEAENAIDVAGDGAHAIAEGR